jgi:hypothetical protein
MRKTSRLKKEIDKVDSKFEKQFEKLRTKYKEEREGFTELCKHMWDDGNSSIVLELNPVQDRCEICGEIIPMKSYMQKGVNVHERNNNDF